MKNYSPILWLLVHALCTHTNAPATIDIDNLLQHFNISVYMDQEWVNELNALGTLASPRSAVTSSSINIPLFAAYPRLKERLPHRVLGDLPTPVEKLKNLGTHFNHPHLYIKRDDLTGAKQEDGSHLYGGNKIRKLEFLFAEALAHGATTVMTFGAAGSNHAVATSIYAHQLGLKSICMLKPQIPSPGIRKNLLLHQQYKSELHYYRTSDIHKIGVLHTWLDHYNTYGNFPYIIPTGGSSPLGAVGFVNAAFELKEQIDRRQLPEPDFIYVPAGSMGTVAGLSLGCKAAGLKSKIVAITIEPEDENAFKHNINRLVHQTNMLLHNLDSSFPLHELSENDIIINYTFCGTEYGLPTPAGIHASSLMKDTEGIVLDGTYTAKAFAGLINDIENHRINDKVVLFWDTYCGLDIPGALPKNSYTQLPYCFHAYFEQELQPLELTRDKTLL